MKLSDILGGHRNFLRLLRLVITRARLGDDVAFGKMNAHRVRRTRRAGQAIVRAVKARRHRADRGAACDVQLGRGVAGQRDAHFLFLQWLAAQLHAGILAPWQITTIDGVFCRATGFADGRHDEVDVRPLRNGQAIHMRGAATVGEIMHRRVIVAIRRGGEIERLAEAVAFQLQLVRILEHQHRRHDGVNILGLAIN